MFEKLIIKMNRVTVRVIAPEVKISGIPGRKFQNLMGTSRIFSRRKGH